MSSTIEKVKDILHINKDKNTTDTSNEIHRNDHPQGHVGSHNTATTDFTNVGASHQPETVPRYGKSEQITGYNDPSINSAKYDPQASGRLDICHVTDEYDSRADKIQNVHTNTDSDPVTSESDTGCGLTSGKKGARSTRKSKSPSNTGSHSSCFLNKLDPRTKPATHYSDQNYMRTPLGTSLARDNAVNVMAGTLDPRFASHRDNRPPPIDYHDTAQVPPSVFIPLNGEGKKGHHARRKSVVSRPE